MKGLVLVKFMTNDTAVDFVRCLPLPPNYPNYPKWYGWIAGGQYESLAFPVIKNVHRVLYCSACSHTVSLLYAAC